MRRRLLTCLLFLPLFLASSLWIRSYFVEDDLQCLRGLYDDVRDQGDFSEEDKAAPIVLPVQQRYFTLASGSGDLALAKHDPGTSFYEVRASAWVVYRFGWRNSPTDPILEGDTGYPTWGPDENPLFRPREWRDEVLHERRLYSRADLHFWNSLGFVYDNTSSAGRMWSIRVWHCPWWIITLVAMVPLWKFPVRWIRSRRRLKGLCAKCNYDLRAHQPGDNCPECGALVESQMMSPQGAGGR